MAKNLKVGERVLHHIAEPKGVMRGTVTEVRPHRYCAVKYDGITRVCSVHESTLIRLKKKPKPLRVEFESTLSKENYMDGSSRVVIDLTGDPLKTMSCKRVRVRVEALE